MYQRIPEYPKALLSYEEVLENRQQHIPLNHNNVYLLITILLTLHT
jgi:hypothetical protein